ncbi:MAG: cobyrinate a,c-diamide synthase [Rhizobiales bacterium]|nr:cobyrinate a,c-diamide synthase [Hyphomicrobiales bacterium]
MNSSPYKKVIVIAAPSSGSGKTLVTLALLRALKNAGHRVCSAKAGPDYIDPAFHSVASGKASVNLDPWAMNEDRLRGLAHGQDGELLIVEAMMGLFDGAADGNGSAADLAVVLGAPIILVVDAAKQSHSIAALVQGFANHRDDVNVVGVILNKVGSTRHEAILRNALGAINMPVFGVIYRDDKLILPERHLGLVQAVEQNTLEDFIETTAQIIGLKCDLDAIVEKSSLLSFDKYSSGLSPLGQRIAIARDEAFSFIYPHLLSDWKRLGAEVSFFSPLENEAPNKNADAIYLPGGYPELHAEKISGATKFHLSMKAAAQNGKIIYGECGGYMVMGQGIVDKNDKTHKMLGLLNLQTSFANRKLHLGYRRIEPIGDFPFSDKVGGSKFFAHEFHYTSEIKEEGERLFNAKDALGSSLGDVGLRDGSIMGSYMHIIDEDSA